MAPSLPLVTALFTAARAHLDESSMLQMLVKNQDVVVDDDACRCPGYFEAECTAEAAQGCVWSSQGSSNGPWCQCLGDAVPVPITPVTLPPVTLPPVHMDLQVVCDVDACFARCESFYGGSLDTGDAYYCAKGCAPNSASTSMNSAYYCNVNVQDRESTCLHNVDSGASEFCSSISSNHPQCEFGCGFWTLPPVTAPPVTEPVDDESFCAAQCQAAGNCCNDPSIGSNQQISCAQACMMRASGQRMDAMLSANGGICNRAGNSGCSLEVQGQSYSFCQSCQDLQEHCPHGVQSSDECDFGASLLPPSAVVDPEPVTAAPEPVTAAPAPVTVTPVTAAPEPVTAAPAPVTAAPEPASCPGGWLQVGESGADIGGCGLQPCDQRYQTTSEEQCASACDAMAGCQGFNYSPLNGDRNHETERVCTLYNSDTPTGSWSGTAGFVQVFCTRVSPPEVTEPPVALIPECESGGFMTGDGTGIGAHETYIGTASSPEVCVAMVHDQCPSANGATLPTSGDGGCYCEFAMTGVNSNSHWSSCQFAVPVAEPEPPVNTFSQCDGGSFLTGDGVGGHETNIGTAASAEECVAMVREQCPEANGATLPTSGSGGCYCEFGMTGVNTSPSWQSCNFLAPPEESPPPTTSIPECVGGTFLTGDGAGGHETNIGAASSPQECVAMVLEQCPGANGATLPAGGDGNCYCEFSMSSLNGNTHWQSCQFEEAARTLIDECNGGAYLIGDGTGGHETHIGSAATPEECVTMVHQQCPGANGATLPTSGSGGCYCEYGMTDVNSNQHWSSCHFAVPVVEPDQTQCAPPVDSTADAGYSDDYRGWYDVQGCGECNDYCRWVGNTGSLGDPSANFHLGQDGAGNPSWWSCRLAGTTDTYSARGLFTSFDFQKCAGQR